MSTVVKHDNGASVEDNIVNGGLPNSVDNPILRRVIGVGQSIQ